jgi:hypothetical protein
MRQKQLDTTGNKIESFDLKVTDDQIYLNLVVDDNVRGREEYKYRISGDLRFSIKYLESNIPSELNFARENYCKVTIKEYTERDYLYFHVHDKRFNMMQITGVRLK